MRKIFFILLLLVLLVVAHAKILTGVGSLLVVREIPANADAAVVLHTGVDIYPRLIEAADLYQQGTVQKVVINGNRKTDVLRRLESSGYEPPAKWYAEEINVLNHQGVSKDNIIAVSAEDAYDTISEAKIVGEILVNNGFSSVILATSKFHSRRARRIWGKMYKDRLSIYVAPAQDDTFNPAAWWKNGRQIRWVLSEYGAWIYYSWVTLFDRHLLP